ncbi:hypothetical protein POM88_020042 [Heracleum sosnowskyi]|uniref:Uncharacterized protein n=1 Tax=Heracleum sosnowskyi TaxID=360622 RepID=A0AAD8MRG1_9APIA|nr:hypothetical protein POM88_020042 [Heracleum sosnowskyi]
MWELNRVPHVFEKLKILDMSDSQDLTTIPDFTKLPCLETLNLKGCESLEEVHISIESFFQLYSQFGHPIQICSTKFPDWISQSSEYESMSFKESIESNEYYPTMSLDLPTNVSHNYLGMILCIRSSKSFTSYSVEKTTSDFIWRGEFESDGYKSLMVIVPRSTFCVEDGDDKIILKANRRSKVYGIHLLYKTEEYDSTAVNED